MFLHWRRSLPPHSIVPRAPSEQCSPALAAITPTDFCSSGSSIRAFLAPRSLKLPVCCLYCEKSHASVTVERLREVESRRESNEEAKADPHAYMCMSVSRYLSSKNQGCHYARADVPMSHLDVPFVNAQSCEESVSKSLVLNHEQDNNL